MNPHTCSPSRCSARAPGVTRPADLSPQGWLELGGKQRATAATGMNDKSSRSHAVLSLLMTRTQVGGPGPCLPLPGFSWFL